MKLITFALALLISSSTYAGGSSAGNGVDHPDRDDFIWFQNANREIRYCYLVSSDFGAHDADVSRLLPKAFKMWNDYIDQKKIKTAVYYTPFSTQARKLSKCDGTEDVRFNFGVFDERLISVYAQHPRAYGFVHLLEFSNGWGKGIVHVSKSNSFGKNDPYWNLNDNLLAILLHEIGHLYGISHVDGTVMDSDIAYRFTNTREPEFTPQIDGHKELYICDECTEEEFLPDFRVSQNVLKVTFAKLIHREPIGKISATFVKTSTVSHYHLPVGYLKLSDSSGSYTLKVTSQIMLGQSRNWNEQLFKVRSSPVSSISLSTYSQTIQAVIEDAAGMHLPILIRRNIEPYLFSLWFLDSASPSPNELYMAEEVRSGLR